MKGHIRERSPGRWAIVIDVHDSQTGARKRRWHSFKGNKRGAQVEAARLISEAQQGGAVDPSRTREGRRHFSGARRGRWLIPEPGRDQSGLGPGCTGL
jgi:hypothetical protein